MVVGWMWRSCTVDGVQYSWEELLLYDAAATAFSWLLRSDGHWQFASRRPQPT